MKPNQIIAQQQQKDGCNLGNKSTYTHTLSTILREEGVFIRRNMQNYCTISYGKGLMDSFSESGSEREDACFKNKQKEQING